MTARQVFEAMLVELNNTNSPSLLLDDYNHFINKAVDMYINKRYINYDLAQQNTDDLRVLKSTAILSVTKRVSGDSGTLSSTSIDSSLLEYINKDKSFDAIYEVNLPSDYLHTLNCMCIYNVNQRSGCYDPGDVARYAATRLTADSWSTIVNDYYNRPTPKRPYYYIHNINTSSDLPTNKYASTSGSLGSGTDLYASTSTGTGTTTTSYELYSLVKSSEEATEGTATLIGTFDTLAKANAKIDSEESTTGTNQQAVKTAPALSTATTTKIYYILDKSSESTTNAGYINFAKVIKSNNVDVSTVEREAGIRYGNASTVRMEVRYGQGDVFELKGVMVDYIKAPQHIRLTKNQMDLTEDTSQIMEFPDYVCQEIINELVTLVMQNNADPRLQTFIPVNQSIVDQARQLATQQTAAKAAQ